MGFADHLGHILVGHGIHLVQSYMYLIKKFPSLGTKDASYLLRIVFGNSDHSGKYNEKKSWSSEGQTKDLF